MQKYYERIIGNKLSLLKFIWVDLLNECIPLLKSPEVKLILNTLHFQIRRASKCAEFDRTGVGKREKHKLPTLIFSPFLDNRQKFVKEGNVSKKVGVTDLFKSQNPREVVVLAKSVIFAYKSSSVHVFDE